MGFPEIQLQRKRNPQPSHAMLHALCPMLHAPPPIPPAPFSAFFFFLKPVCLIFAGHQKKPAK